MAVVSRIPFIPPEISPMRHPGIGMRASTREIAKEPQPPAPAPAVHVVEDMMYVAVGTNIKESKLVVTWALHNSGGRKICILHVHEPDQWIPAMGTKFPARQAEELQLRAHRQGEKQEMNKLLQDYRTMCSNAGVRAEVVNMEMNSIEKGIVELIKQHGIRKLVMGAAADKHYSKKMMEPKSKKAIYVRLQAPTSCHIWFICKGNLVYTREGRSEGVSMDVASSTLQAGQNTETTQSSSWRSQSIAEGANDQLRLTNSGRNYHRALSALPRISVSTFSSDRSSGLTPRTSSIAGRSSADWDEPCNSHYSSRSSDEMADVSALALVLTKEDHHQFSSPPSVSEGRRSVELYDRLEQSMAEAENSRREAFDESMRRRKAEKDAIDANHRAQALERLYAEEVRQRKEVEEALARGKEELKKMKQQVAEVVEEHHIAVEHKSSLESQIANSNLMVKDLERLYAEEVRQRKEVEEALARGKEERKKMKQQVAEVVEALHIAVEHKSSLESQIANSNLMVKDLEQKCFSAEELLQKCKKERDELQAERDNVLKEAEELRKEQAEASANTLAPEFFYEFSFSEIVEATSSFDLSLKIGEGGYGNIYKGLLRHTEVAIKMLHPDSKQGPSEFQQEVTVLSKLRHPNIVTLIGACPQNFILVYEYLPNGSLEDRLCCKDNSPPLSWQTRIRIAAELCSALIFLHSCNPNRIVHGDLKPANILLDSNFVSKLSDFGICRILNQNEFSSNNTTLCCITDHPRGTIAYIDPEFLSTGEMTTKSDVYSFGIILLQLLTGRPAKGIAKEVKCALDKGNLKNLLDPTAGDWPFVQAQGLARIATRCCEMNRQSRPDLASDVWRVLERMSVSCGASPFLMNSKEDCQIPPYFRCPLLQEIMHNPHVAADGYTYEYEAIKGWLDGGRDASPMTDLKLPHCNLLPNRALWSAIQEWQRRR
ncbi:hypothetical protein Vadar_018582 [Vaccinium darrowii]|uniref:Uncharacterized protein n=1 Tax=Vaccinium darrowii TaxID=229202 RepID=A0ACB7ZD37_9ERIC|nr:hypothetical protein Vadar_018582 [Vaccinium darrowii]